MSLPAVPRWFTASDRFSVLLNCSRQGTQREKNDPAVKRKREQVGGGQAFFPSHVQVPPLEVERFPADIGAAVHLPQQFVVGGEVVDEGAAQAQALHQGAHLRLQGAASVHLGAKRLRDAQVFPQNNHVHLRYT